MARENCILQLIRLRNLKGAWTRGFPWPFHISLSQNCNTVSVKNKSQDKAMFVSHEDLSGLNEGWLEVGNNFSLERFKEVDTLSKVGGRGQGDGHILWFLNEKLSSEFLGYPLKLTTFKCSYSPWKLFWIDPTYSAR